MNKAYIKKENIIMTLFIVCFIFFNSACGLDTYYVIDPPGLVVNEPEYQSLDPSSQYFEFYTNEKDYEGLKFLGTEIYYRIYRNADRLKSDCNTIIAAANNTEKSSNTPTMLDSYKFKTLEAYGYNETVLVPSAGISRLVHVRLSDYDPYFAQMLVAGSYFYGAAAKVIPIRNYASIKDPLSTSIYSFSFKQIDSSLRPKSGDEDVDYSGSGSDSVWYVAMFAVSVAQEATYARDRSNVLYLGSVTINVD